MSQSSRWKTRRADFCTIHIAVFSLRTLPLDEIPVAIRAAPRTSPRRTFKHRSWGPLLTGSWVSRSGAQISSSCRVRSDGHCYRAAEETTLREIRHVIFSLILAWWSRRCSTLVVGRDRWEHRSRLGRSAGVVRTEFYTTCHFPIRSRYSRDRASGRSRSLVSPSSVIGASRSTGLVCRRRIVVFLRCIHRQVGPRSAGACHFARRGPRRLHPRGKSSNLRPLYSLSTSLGRHAWVLSVDRQSPSSTTRVAHFGPRNRPRTAPSYVESSPSPVAVQSRSHPSTPIPRAKTNS